MRLEDLRPVRLELQHLPKPVPRGGLELDVMGIGIRGLLTGLGIVMDGDKDRDG